MRSSLTISLRIVLALTLALFAVSACSAQFTGNVQGVAQDPSGAGVAKAGVRIVNGDTQVSAAANSDDSVAKILERALALDPGNAQERKLVASVELRAHQPKAAITTLEPLLESNQPDVETLELASEASGQLSCNSLSNNSMYFSYLSLRCPRKQ